LTIVVTGGTGFIGSRLLARLNARDNVKCIALDTPSIRVPGIAYEQCDLQDYSRLASLLGTPRAVVHLAAMNDARDSLIRPMAYFDANVRSTACLLEACRVHAVKRVVFASTAALYRPADTLPIGESSSVRSDNPYAASKRAAELWAETYQSNFGLQTCTLRLFNVYGPGQLTQAVIPKILYQLMGGQQLTLGNVDARRDFVFVDDVISAIERAIEAPWHAELGLINVGAGTSHSIREVAETAARLLGREPAVRENTEHRPVAAEVDFLQADIGRAAKRLGWRPEVDLQGGLEKTIAWYRERFSMLEKTFHG